MGREQETGAIVHGRGQARVQSQSTSTQAHNTQYIKGGNTRSGGLSDFAVVVVFLVLIVYVFLIVVAVMVIVFLVLIVFVLLIAVAVMVVRHHQWSKFKWGGVGQGAKTNQNSNGKGQGRKPRPINVKAGDAP